MSEPHSGLEPSLYFAGSGLFLLVLPPLCVFVYHTYKRTHPEVANAWFWSLVALRSTAFALLVALLAEPIVEFWNKRVENPRLLVLVDTSHSMGVLDGDSTRFAQVQSFLSQSVWVEGTENVDVQYWAFAHSAYSFAAEAIGTLQPGGLSTNIGGAIEEIAQHIGGLGSVQGLLLLSDGAHNLGLDPIKVVEEQKVPIYSLVVGGEEQPADVQIVDARVEGNGYVGKALTIRAKLSNQGYASARAMLYLYDGQRELERREIDLKLGAQMVQLSAVPQTPGPHIYRLRVDPLPGELTRDNNETLVFTRVLEERVRVVVVANRPSSELGFLYRNLAADSTLSVAVVTRKDDDATYSGAWNYTAIEQADVLVLLGYDDAMWQGSAGAKLRQQVSDGMGLLLVGEPAMGDRWSRAYALDVLLPIALQAAPFTERATRLRIGMRGANHPIVRLAVEQEIDPWTQLPPLTGFFPVEGLRQGALALVESSEGRPIVASGVYGRGKTLAALSHSFWRLDLLSSGVSGNPQTIRQFWRHAVRWLATRSPVGRVRASTERYVYRAGYPVLFTCQVFDELLQPQEGCAVNIELSNGDAVAMQDQGGGFYGGEFSGLSAGDYSYVVGAECEGASVGSDRGDFIVDKHSVEWADVRANRALLEQLAHASGGMVLGIKDGTELLRNWPLKQTLVEDKQAVHFWGGLTPLVLVALALAAEWILRKRLGML